MQNQRGSKKKAAIAVFLLFLSLGTFSHVIAITEIDPTDLVDFSTYFGGTGDDRIETISYAFGSTVVDSQGNIIVVGRTESTDFPVKNAFQDHLNGTSDGTISKFSPNGSLIFSTYLGGSQQEVPTGVAVDSEDNIIVAGVTGSSDFPILNPLQSNFTGGSEGNADCFITKLSEDGQSLIFSTYLGGTGSDWLYTMNVYSNDRIAISGTTESDDFPVLNAHQTTRSGNLDVFITLIEADGQSLLFSSYLGTPTTDHGRQVDFDSQGNVLLAGMIGDGDLATGDVFQDEYGGGPSDGFLAKFEIDGTLVYLTYIGGTLQEWGNDLTVDTDDNAIVTGFTTSDDFPILNAYQEERAGSMDIFVTKITPDGEEAVFSTYFGGSSSDYGNAITTDSQNRIVVIGQTTSDDFPTTISYSTSESYYNNVTVTVLDKDGSLLLSMVFGGENHNIGIGVAWHSEASYVVVGYTSSDNFPVHEAYQATYAGDNDMFIMKFNLESIIDISQGGFPFDLMVVGVAVGVVVIVAILLLIRKRTG